MVTEAGKELLRNTINTAKFHNRILEENEMWKQWELERGLTMMVSDDDVLRKIKKHHQCSKHRRRDRSRDKCKSKIEEKCKPLAGSSKEVTDRWDHSGFQELYPDEVISDRHSSSLSKSHNKKWDHSGFYELYPGESISDGHSSSSSKSHDKKQKKKKRKHHTKCSSADKEIWEEFKLFRRSKMEKQKAKSKESVASISSRFDNHVKEWHKHTDAEQSNS